MKNVVWLPTDHNLLVGIIKNNNFKGKEKSITSHFREREKLKRSYTNNKNKNTE